MMPTLARARRVRLPDPADRDAYALALRALVSAVDRHSTGPLRSELADALRDARELLRADGGVGA